MIGARLHLILRIAAWLLIACAPVTAYALYTEAIASGSNFSARLATSILVGCTSFLVYGGALLTLLSIDKRLGAKG